MTHSVPIASGLAEFAARPTVTAPAPVRATAARHLIDVVGCGLAAVGSSAGGHASAVVMAAGGEPRSTVIGELQAVPAAAAALANGTFFHALDFDDTHEAGICHVSAVVAPAAFAVGQATGATGARVVDAYLVGCEVALRIAVAAAPGLYARGFHPTSVCGVFGAAAAAAHLEGLTPARTTNALGIAGSLASGLFEYLSDGSETKPLHAGWAAQAGVQASALAQAGATGPATVIEGRFGLLASHTDRSTDLGSVLDGLGDRWEITNVAIKPYPACHFVHAAAWAVGRLTETHGVGATDVERIDVQIAREGVALVLDPLAGKRLPTTPYDAKFSLPYAVAHRLVRGRLDLASFSQDSIGDPTVLAVASRVGGEAWRGGEPPSRFGSEVAMLLRDGTQLTLAVPYTPGSPQNPLPDDALLAKFRQNASLALDIDGVEDITARLAAFDGPEPAASTLERLGPAATSATDAG